MAASQELSQSKLKADSEMANIPDNAAEGKIQNRIVGASNISGTSEGTTVITTSPLASELEENENRDEWSQRSEMDFTYHQASTEVTNNDVT